jgi:translation initiation factor IF-2
MPQFANKPGAMTAMSRTGLEHGLPVHGNSVKVSPSQLQGASALGRIDANPTRAATLGGRLARPPAATFSQRPTVSRMTPPATRQAGLTSGRENPATRPSAGQSAKASEPGAAGNRAGSAPAERYVPRPPQSSQGRTESSMVAMNHNVPRPPSGTRPGSTSDRVGTPTRSQVPRPSGQAAPAPSHYSGNQGSYTARSYGDYAGTYSNRAYSNYGGYGRAGNTNSRYGAPPYATYGGHSSYSAPSHSSGASRGYSGGSHGGGGGGHASGGSHGGHR